MKKLERPFRWSAVLLLLFTSAAKLASATGQTPILDLPDPLFGLPNRQLLIAVGVLELAVAVALLSRVAGALKHLLLLWLSTGFLAYRLAHYWINPGKPCPCLGTLTDKLPLSPATLDAALLGLVLFLLIGSLSMLMWLVREGPTATRIVEGRGAQLPERA